MNIDEYQLQSLIDEVCIVLTSDWERISKKEPCAPPGFDIEINNTAAIEVYNCNQAIKVMVGEASWSRHTGVGFCLGQKHWPEWHLAHYSSEDDLVLASIKVLLEFIKS